MATEDARIDVRKMFPDLDENAWNFLEVLQAGKFGRFSNGSYVTMDITNIQQVLLVQRQAAIVLVAAGASNARRDEIYTTFVLPMLHSVIGRDPGYNSLGLEAEAEV